MNGGPASVFMCTLAALGLALAACNAAPSPSPTRAGGNLELPTIDIGANGACAGVGTEAVLAGDPQDPRVAWLMSGGTRVDIVFPAGFTARFAPTLEVLDTSGAVVARAGDRIDGYCVTGGPPLVLWP